MARPIEDILAVLEELAPLGLAEDWDNVGLLLEPRQNARIERILLTVDLTEAVLEEALAQKADLVLAYHPPIFKGVRRLTRRRASERILLDAVRAGLFVYSPHTALDAVSGGINDWLIGLFGVGSTKPIMPHPRIEGVGAGRFAALAAPLSLAEAIARCKLGLGWSHLRVATSDRHQKGEPIRTVGVCAGAGGSVFERLAHADLLLTGEMRHHDVLSRMADGTSVIVTDHTNTERGYLPRLASTLARRVPEVTFTVSAVDRDPLVPS